MALIQHCRGAAVLVALSFWLWLPADANAANWVNNPNGLRYDVTDEADLVNNLTTDILQVNAIGRDTSFTATNSVKAKRIELFKVSNLAVTIYTLDMSGNSTVIVSTGNSLNPPHDNILIGNLIFGASQGLWVNVPIEDTDAFTLGGVSAYWVRTRITLLGKTTTSAA